MYEILWVGTSPFLETDTAGKTPVAISSKGKDPGLSKEMKNVIHTNIGLKTEWLTVR